MFKRKDIKISNINKNKESYLEINKKILDNGNKEYINVFILMDHQRNDYKEIHNDEIMNSSDILKNKNYKVIFALYNNRVLGYLDFNLKNDMITDFYIKDDFFNKEEALYQMLYLLTNEVKTHVIVKCEKDNVYYDCFINMGFKNK